MKKEIIQIIKILKRKKIMISVVESCTGGLLSSAITSMGGASKYLQWGWSLILIKQRQVL